MANAVNNSVYYIFGAIIKAAASFLLLPVFANLLGAEQYGVLNLLQTFSTILITLMTFATERSLYRLFYDYESENEKKLFLSTVFWAINILGLFVFCVFIIYGGYVVKYLGAIDVNTILLPTILYTFFMSLINYSQIIMQIEQNGLKYLKISMLFLLFYNLLSLLFLFFYAKTVKAMVYGNLIANIVVLPVALYYIRSRIGLVFSFSVLCKTLRFSLPLFLMIVFAWVLHMTDRMFIANFANLKDAGVYSLASKFVQLAILLMGAIYQAYGPYFYKTANTFNYLDVKKKLKPINRCLTLVVCVISFVIAALSKPVLFTFFNSEYYACISFIYLLAVSCVFTQQSGLLNVMIYQNKKTLGLSLITILGGVISVMLNVTLIPLIGAIAAGISNLVVGIVMFILTLRLAKTQYYIPLGVDVIFYSIAFFLVSYIIDQCFDSVFILVMVKITMLFLFVLVAKKKLGFNEEPYKILLFNLKEQLNNKIKNVVSIYYK